MKQPLHTISATEAIVDSLKERILTGEFEPGEQLPNEQVLLREYGVSRLTLREALARLVALGIIRVQHGKGSFVAENISTTALGSVLIPLFPQYDATRMKDLVETRNLIESEVAAVVADEHSEEDFAALNNLLDYDEAVLTDPERFAQRDFDFHMKLVTIAGNTFFTALYQALYQQINSFLFQYAMSIENREEAMERHRPILEAIEHRDAEAARRLAREHAAICASFIKSNTFHKGV